MKAAVRHLILNPVSDVSKYIRAVELADGQVLEQSTKDAISNFVAGCKSDNIWDAIQDCCILSGARTLSGALVPLKGAAPTNLNFVSADYNRATGLIGNGTNKELNTNKSHNTYPQGNFHHSCWLSSNATVTSIYMGAGLVSNESGASNFGFVTPNTLFFRNQSATNENITNSFTPSLYATSRSNTSGFSRAYNNTSTFAVIPSQTPLNANIFVFSSGAFRTNARIAFYSIGTALDLSLLSNRVTTLINSFGGLT